MLQLILSTLAIQYYAMAQSTGPDAMKEIIDGLTSSCDDAARLWIRAAFHDAGTFNLRDRSGGMDGSLQFELSRTENRGLAGFVGFVRSVARQTKVSVADTLAYSGVRAVDLCNGGDINAQFKFGRKDARVANKPGLLPDPRIGTKAVIDMFVTRQGFTKEETLALVAGAHSAAKVHPQNHPGAAFVAGVTRPFPLDSTVDDIDNKFFTQIRDPRARRIPGDVNMMRDTDIAKLAVQFQSNNTAFLISFQRSFLKMINLGFRVPE